MAIGKTDSQYYTEIAAAIRTRNGQTTKYKPSEMAVAVRALASSKPVTVAVNYPSAITDKVSHEFIAGGISMKKGELLTLKIRSTYVGYSISSTPTATMDGVTFDLSPYLVTGRTQYWTDTYICKYITIKDLPVTGDLVITVVAGYSNAYLNCATAENGTTSGDSYRQPGGSIRLTFIPDAGYRIPSYTNISDAFSGSWITITDINTGNVVDYASVQGKVELTNSDGKLYLTIIAINFEYNWHVVFEKE